MKDKLIQGAIGLAGVGSIEVVNTAKAIDPAQISDGLSIVSQIVILIVTLFGLFKKNKVAKNQKN